MYHLLTIYHIHLIYHLPSHSFTLLPSASSSGDPHSGLSLLYSAPPGPPLALYRLYLYIIIFKAIYRYMCCSHCVSVEEESGVLTNKSGLKIVHESNVSSAFSCVPTLSCLTSTTAVLVRVCCNTWQSYNDLRFFGFLGLPPCHSIHEEGPSIYDSH
jgi:hypothetical protein